LPIVGDERQALRLGLGREGADGDIYWAEPRNVVKRYRGKGASKSGEIQSLLSSLFLALQTPARRRFLSTSERWGLLR
jgi:hypothetical protein